MKNVWNMISKSEISYRAKNSVFILLMVLISMIAGGTVWTLLGRFFLLDLIWLVCFMCYPAIFVGFIGAISYLYNHEFT